MPTKRISNKISISSIDDGTTIHGGLRATKALAQGYGDGNFRPDWSVSANQPIIYLTLLSGSTPAVPSGGDVTWIWNSTELTFDANGYSTNAKDSDNNPLFQKLTGNSRYQWNGVRVPSLKIVNNLAIAGSLNNDTIQCSGNVELAGELIPFSSGVTIQLCELNANGYLGVINFVNGKSTLNGDDDQVVAWAELYSAGAVSGWDCDWYFNGQKVTSTSSGSAVYLGKKSGLGTTGYNQVTVKGDDNGGVVDVGTLVCIFKMKDVNNVWQEVATATESIDDISDEEFMYTYFTIGTNTGATQSDGSPVSLRSGQYVTWNVHVAKEGDATAVNQTYKNFYFQPRDASGSLFSGIADLGAADSSIGSGFYKMKYGDGKTNLTGSGATSDPNHGRMIVQYQEVVNAGKNISGVVLATD